MRTTIVLLSIMAAAAALAQEPNNVLRQHNPVYMLNGSDTIANPAYLNFFPALGQIEIVKAIPGEPFRFEATLVDGQGYAGPGAINVIAADPNAGDFSITLVGSAGHEFGASDVGQISLIGTNTNGRIDQLKISGTLAQHDSVAAASAGTLECGGVDHDVAISGAISGAVTIHGVLNAELACDQLGDLTASAADPPFSFATGAITVRGPYSSTMTVNHSLSKLTIQGAISGSVHACTPMPAKLSAADLGPITATGEVQINDVRAVNTTDEFRVRGNVDGALTVTGTLNAPATIEGAVSGRMRCHLGYETTATLEGGVPAGGRVYVGDLFFARVVSLGNLAGELRAGDLGHGAIDIGQAVAPADLTGTILVDGDIAFAFIVVYGDVVDPTVDPNGPAADLARGHILVNGAYQAGGITVLGAMTGARPFIVLDYDGPDAGDEWTGGTISVNGAIVNPNTTSLNVRYVSRCRGDIDSNGVVNFADISPFVQALSDVRAYSLAHPGLGALWAPWDPEAGSRLWHGDANCSGVFDFADINALVTILSTGCCTYDCVPCQQLNGRPGDGPGENLLMNGQDGDGQDNINDAEALASILDANLAAADRPAFDALVSAYITEEPDAALRAFWSEVAANLP